ncbi:DUF2232 domain-containing protein [Ciceribacter sp. L1K22]|uniref:DUF2232 domain-containing protein n=1 Tax=Ciceribacter sp. L1K22 TaxID=2820275 RepID=UPI001ABDFC34|nr:DUF2232 domain-containing protein [Ciceribacter sp. L1K22]
MKQLDGKLLTTGMLAGLTAALLVLAANAQPSLSSFLYAASAMPILIAGLGWGNVAAIAAIVTAAALGSIAVSPLFAASMAIFTLLPAGWVSHLASLARPASEIGGPDHLIAWYPLSDILMHLCALIALAVVFLGVMIGYGPEFIRELVNAVMTAATAQEGAFQPTADDIAQIERLMLVLLPVVQGGMWVMMLTATYYFAMRIVTASGRAKRPREDMPSALRMNRNAMLIFLAGLLAAFVGGPIGLVGVTVCGTFGAGFLMAGFASLHLRTRGKDWRLPVLVLAYLSVLFLLPTFIILILGLADARRTVALTPAQKADTKSDNNETQD